jgi:PadR family transcriptional regulator, regulatory protein PadR
MKAEVLKGHLDLLLLAAVQDRPAHGYAIAEKLRARSKGAFDLPEGTLYPALHRLERAGVLASRWSEVNGRRRRVYQLTAKGQRALAKQHDEWHDFARAVHAVVGRPHEA